MLLVLVPPDPTHCRLSFTTSSFFVRLIDRQLSLLLAENLKIYLKDVGANLVANLSLLSEFSKALAEAADWWSSVKDDLVKEESALLALGSPRYGDDSEIEKGIGNLEGESFAWWNEMRDDFQEYYDVVSFLAIVIMQRSYQHSRSALYISDSPNYFHHQSQPGNQ